VNVYKYANPGQSLNSQDLAKDLAKKMSFNPEAIVRQGSLENTTYVWNDITTARTLTVKAKNLNFTLKTDYTKSNVTLNGTLPTDDSAISKASDYIQSLGKLTEDYSKNKPSVTLLAIEPDGSFKQVRAKADAKLMRIDYFREKAIITVKSSDSSAKTIKTTLEKQGFITSIDKVSDTTGSYDVYNFDTIVAMQDPNKSYLSVYIGASKKADSTTTSIDIRGIDYTNWYVDQIPCGTYELNPPSVAIDSLSKGQGSLIYLREKNADTVVAYTPQSVSKFTILEVKIMYYDSPTEALYMQPIYRIKGTATLKTGISGEFYYYVPAINYDLVQDAAVQTVTPTTKTGTTGILGN
jgi:hypothetical protein